MGRKLPEENLIIPRPLMGRVGGNKRLYFKRIFRKITGFSVVYSPIPFFPRQRGKRLTRRSLQSHQWAEEAFELSPLLTRHVSQYDVMVITGFKVIKNFFNFAVAVEQEADAVNAVIGFTHKGFLTPHAKRLTDLMVFI